MPRSWNWHLTALAMALAAPDEHGTSRYPPASAPPKFSEPEPPCYNGADGTNVSGIEGFPAAPAMAFDFAGGDALRARLRAQPSARRGRKRWKDGVPKATRHGQTRRKRW